MKKSLPAYVHRKKSNGQLYFVKRYGKTAVWKRLETQFAEGDKIPLALHLEVERLKDAPTPKAMGKDIDAVIEHFEAERFESLSRRTRLDYAKLHDEIREKIGHIEPRSVERRHVLNWRKGWADKFTPDRANRLTAAIGRLMESAKDMGLLTTENPAKGIRSLKVEGIERGPWPPEMVEAFRATATGRTLLLFELCIGTGQRIGDVLEMRWSDIQGDAVQVTQNKTEVKLSIPLTERLRAALAATERRSVFILTNHRATGAWSYRGASDAVMKVRKQIGAEAYDIHALRYTAARELLLAGCDDDDIASVTGQSPQMVRHYTRHDRQKVRAIRAQKRRDEQ